MKEILPAGQAFPATFPTNVGQNATEATGALHGK